MPVGLRDRLLVCTARHGRRRRQQADPAGVSRDHRKLSGWSKHTDHVDVLARRLDVALNRVERRGGRRVARDHQ